MYKTLINCHHLRIIFCLLDGFEICFVKGEKKCVSFPFMYSDPYVEEWINKFPSLPSQ